MQSPSHLPREQNLIPRRPPTCVSLAHTTPAWALDFNLKLARNRRRLILKSHAHAAREGKHAAARLLPVTAVEAQNSRMHAMKYENSSSSLFFLFSQVSLHDEQ